MKDIKKEHVLTQAEMSRRYQGLAQIGTEVDSYYRLKIGVQVWYPLSEQKPLHQGFAQANDFYLLMPKREVIREDREITLPWFLNQLHYQPIFPEATEKIAEICHAEPKASLKAAAFNGTPAMGTLPGFYYEADHSMGFRINPQSFYASHILFFTTGYAYNGKLVGLSKLATESSVWLQHKPEEAHYRINLVVVHSHLLAQALGYKNPAEMLRELFIEPFNERYEGAEKLAPARTASWLRDRKAEMSGLSAEELSRLVEEYNSRVMTFWTCFIKSSARSELGRRLSRPPTMVVLDNRRAIVYRAPEGDRILACSIYNMSIIRKMSEKVTTAVQGTFTPIQREHEFATIFSIDDRLDEYGASVSRGGMSASLKESAPQESD